MLSQPLQHFINEGQWKVIFLCCRVKFLVIYAHSSPRDGSLWDKLVLTILNDHHSYLFGDHLDRTNLVTMWHDIYDPGVKKFEDFLLHDFPHHIIEPALRLPRWCTIWVNRYAMGTECWAYPLKIYKGIPKDRPMLF
jgi:hypothetical protein